MSSTDLPHHGRRLSARTRLKPPMEVRLSLPTQAADGWIVDQQDDGLGLRLGGADADRLLADPNAWLGGLPTLSLLGLKAPGESLPVRIVHVTPRGDSKHECIVGLVYDRTRMRPEHVLQLLETWQRFEPVAAGRSRT